MVIILYGCITTISEERLEQLRSIEDVKNIVLEDYEALVVVGFFKPIIIKSYGFREKYSNDQFYFSYPQAYSQFELIEGGYHYYKIKLGSNFKIESIYFEKGYYDVADTSKDIKIEKSGTYYYGVFYNDLKGLKYIDELTEEIKEELKNINSSIEIYE